MADPTTPRPWAGWPFYSTDPQIVPQPRPEIGIEYCICDNLPNKDEIAANRCAVCGRPLK